MNTELPIGKPVVLWVSHDTRLNGAPRSLLLTLRGLQEKVRSIVLLYQEGPLCRELEKNRVSFRILRSKEGWGRWTTYANWICNFLEICWITYREGSNLVYGNSSARSQCLLAGKWMGIPTAMHLREMRVSRKGKRVRGSLRYWITGWCVDRRIAVSLATESKFQKTGPYRGKSCVIYNGIRPEDFPDRSLSQEEARERLGIEKRGPWIGHIGSASRRKGVDVFLRMAIQVRRFYPDAQFLVVGVEPNQKARWKGELDHEFALLQNNLHWWPVRHDLSACFRALDIFCNLTRAEPFARVNLEAALHRIPAVATAADGNCEFYVQRETGLLVPSGDPVAAAAAVREILANPAETLKMIEKAEKRTLMKFSAEKYGEEICRSIKELVE